MAENQPGLTGSCLSGRGLQKDVGHPDALSLNTVSFPLDSYEEMTTAMKFPLLVAETTSIVGPFF